MVTGPLLGMQPSKRPHMRSHTELMNSVNGETTSHPNSQPDSPAHTISSLPLTRLSGLRLEEAKRSYLQTAMSSPTSIQHSFYLMASKQAQLQGDKTRSTVDICRHFNNAGGCHSPAGMCRYRHTCLRCKQPGHGKESCPQQT